MTQNERIARLRDLKREYREADTAHRVAQEKRRDAILKILHAPGCTHKNKDGSSAEENVSDHGSSYRCRWCEILDV
jgi:hypothetical protein